MPFQGPDGNWYDDNGQQASAPPPQGGGSGHFYDDPGVEGAITPDSVRALYARYKPGYVPSESEIQSHLTHPGGYKGLEDFFLQTFGPEPTGQAPGAPPPSGGGGNGGGGGGPVGGTLFPPYAPYVPPTPGGLPTAPDFHAPPAFTFADFKAPTGEEAAQMPGYQFSLNQGIQAADQGAAAKGTLRSGGHLKDLVNYGQQLGQQNYQNTFNNAASIYNTNFNTAKAAYQSRYQSALDEFAPKEQGYLTGTNAGLTQNQNNASNAWASWYGQNGLDLDRRKSILGGFLGSQ